MDILEEYHKYIFDLMFKHGITKGKGPLYEWEYFKKYYGGGSNPQSSYYMIVDRLMERRQSIIDSANIGVMSYTQWVRDINLDELGIK